MNKIHFYLLLLSFALMTSCSKDMEPVLIFEIPNEFGLSVAQGLTNSKDIMLTITSLDSFPSNYEIDATVFSSENGYIIYINQFTQSPAISTGLKIIKKELLLENVSNGDYSLDVVIRNTITSQGLLQQMDQLITLDFSKTNGLSTAHCEANHFAMNSFWGVIAIDGSYHVPILASFLAKLRSFSSRVDQPLLGNYGYFSIDEDNHVLLNHSLGENFKTFYMTVDDFSRLDDLVETYKSSYPGFHALVFTASGDLFQQTSIGGSDLELDLVP